MNKKYEIALKLAQAGKNPSRRVYDLLLSAEKSGDPRAIYALATWYLFGSPFTKKNITTATKKLKQAAAGNVASAAYDLAISYEKGIGVRKSAARAFELYTRAALLGDKKSTREIGRMYFHGIGTPRNRRLAQAWLDRAKVLGVRD